ncbi:MAG: hypothetical protein ABIJ18_04090 [archaeon]
MTTDYSTKEEQLCDYEVGYRPANSGINPVVPEVVSDKRRLDITKRRTTCAILRGLAEDNLEELMRPRIRR